MSERIDGRRARGEARRRELVDAALAVLARDGVAGLTHRAVAEEAGVPLASASYHFTGIDDLIATALLRANDELAASLRAEPADRSVARLATLLADEVNHRRALLLAEYELYLRAARQPELRTVALTWLELIADAFAPDLQGVDRRAFKALVEGICLHALLTDEQADADVIERTITAAWPRS